MTRPTPSASAADVRIAVLGMIDGNGHPYSWSAIVNGYDPAMMAACPYPIIPQYLAAQPAGPGGIPAASVTHIWTDNPEEAPHVARAALIPHVLERPEDAIGKVDAVLIATDDGFDHVRRALPFVEARMPVFVDKPLALTSAELSVFREWVDAGARILSSSGLRYAPELDAHCGENSPVGALRWISSVTCKNWERYGVHAVEPVYRLLGPGFTSVRLESRPGLEVAHICHRNGVQVTVPVIADGGATFGTMHLCGTEGQECLRLADTYTAFRRQLLDFITMVRSGTPPYPFSETLEISELLIAGIRSRGEGSRRVEIAATQP